MELGAPFAHAAKKCGQTHDAPLVWEGKKGRARHRTADGL